MTTATPEKNPGANRGETKALEGAASNMPSPVKPDVCMMSVLNIETPPENDLVYGVIDEYAPDIEALAESIKKHGVLEPLVVSRDGYVLSGNRRRMAAIVADVLKVPCRVVDITKDDPRFIETLVAYNGQRVKNIRQIAHEIAVTTDPEVAHRELVASRQTNLHIRAEALDLGDYKYRSEIKGNRPLADACLEIVDDMSDLLPLTVRQIHYLLLNNPPLIHRAKATRYSNNEKSYRVLTNVLTRLRICGEVDMDAIVDETRPVTESAVHKNPQDYLREELNSFLTNYWRDLQQSQADHIELVVEKLTLQSLLMPIAYEFTIPMTVGRGFASTPCRHAMMQRYIKSGKSRLVVVIVSDLDPAGMTIAESFGRSMRDDFHIDENKLFVTKGALNIEQVYELNLPHGEKAKAKASTRREYVARYGPYVWELEAVPPNKLRAMVRDSLLSVMDVAALNREKEAEVDEANELVGYRKAALRIFDHGQKLEGGAE